MMRKCKKIYRCYYHEKTMLCEKKGVKKEGKMSLSW